MVFPILRDILNSCKQATERLAKIDELNSDTMQNLPWATWAEYKQTMLDLENTLFECASIELFLTTLKKYVGIMESLENNSVFIAMMNARDSREQRRIDELPF